MFELGVTVLVKPTSTKSADLPGLLSVKTTGAGGNIFFRLLSLTSRNTKIK